jgi:lysophospholipase L1-like esterase
VQLASQPDQPNQLVYVALGDSAAQSIGASAPEKGYVGLVARQLAIDTGRPVKVINLSVTGATAADVVAVQLPQLAALSPDLITMDIGANDVNRGVSAADFKRDYVTILDALPADKSVIADVPSFGSAEKGRVIASFNAVAVPALAERNIKRAPLFDYTRRTQFNITTYAPDLFHPSNKGYRNWFEAFYPVVKAR